jgi:cytochrome c-type biogenesis protein CcmF
LVSKESALLGNNVMLLVAAAAVLLGTLYPLLLDALNLGKLSVGPPYFETVFMPLMAPAIFLMGVGPLARWKEADFPEIAKRLVWAAGVAVAASVLTAWLAGKVTLTASLGLVMAYWIAGSVLTDLWGRIRPAGASWRSVFTRVGQLPRALSGMLLAHLGVAAFCFGVTMVKTYEIERDVRMAVGDTTTVSGYTFTFKGARDLQGPNYSGMSGLLEVSRGGEKLFDMMPEKRVYRVQQNPMTEAAIHPGLMGDLYVSLGEVVDGQEAWVVRIYVKPFVDWIWGGCLLMALGGLLAVSDRRYRLTRRAETLQKVQAGSISV